MLTQIIKHSIRIYQVMISSILPASCRFEPSCSNYADAALDKHGLWRGGWLILARLVRCHPFCKGGYDPVP